MIVREGSVRIDLLGGTIDLWPINLVLPNVVTLNLATSLKAKVEIKTTDFNGVRFNSLDYNATAEFKEDEFTRENLDSDYFGNFSFFTQILNVFKLNSNLEITLGSDSPPGAGLGGSSAMGITFYHALCEKTGLRFDRDEAVARISDIEARLLDCGPAGYQDYYPALYGGVLALFPSPGSVTVKQLYSSELRENIESRMTLVFSGETRFSGINNWEVYKAFFDKKNNVRSGLFNIAELSFSAFNSIEKGDYDTFLKLIGEEGRERQKLFPNIVTQKVLDLETGLRKVVPELGVKVCGAGGGGCFILIHGEKDRKIIDDNIRDAGMKRLPFTVEKPIG
ncbi:MAG: hypothetical protein KAQ98_02785 [Bacteriovoracaceae bacterium]|nr:hypothetical protein [Bacteriovoracaceae bacterium]